MRNFYISTFFVRNGQCRNSPQISTFLHFYISDVLKPLFPKFAHRATPRRNRGHLPRWTSGGSVPRRDPPPSPVDRPGPCASNRDPCVELRRPQSKADADKEGGALRRSGRPPLAAPTQARYSSEVASLNCPVGELRKQRF